MDWQAEWIWHPPEPETHNFYLHARKTLEITDPPQDALVFVTASSLYQLFVNGEFIGRGPNPADPSRYYYDRYDVTRHLRRGMNVVAALCYNYAPEPKGILNQNWGRGGFLLEMRGPGPDGEVLLKTDSSWRVLHAPAWKQDVPLNCLLYGDYKEVYDSRLEPEGWLESGFDDGDWSEPAVLGRPPVEPWTNLIPREIPRLGGERVRPVNVHWESASVTYPYRDDWELGEWNTEWNLAEGKPHSGKRPDRRELPARMEKTHEDFAPSLILDFGRDVTGYLDVIVADSAGGTVDVLYGEDLWLTRVDTFILKGGRQTLRPYNRRTFRYCKLLFRETPGPIAVEDVFLKMDTYPVERRGAFRCSDDLLNRIWEVGRYTMRLSMLDHFVDCPWRERTLYGGDMWAHNIIAHYAFGDPRMNAKCLRQMAHIQYEEGALPPWGPYRGCGNFYPSWSAFWGLALLDHWDFTGDRELLEELWPNLRSLLDWILGEADNDLGLIGRPGPGADVRGRNEHGAAFRAWMRAPKERFTAWDNIPFHRLLEQARRVARATGRPEEANRYAEGASRMADGIRDRFINPTTGLCVSRGSDEKPGQYNTGLAMWAGLVEEGRGRVAAEQMFAPGVKAVGAPFGALFVTEGLFRYGAADRALDFIRRYWGEMLRRGAGTFWDNFSLDWPTGVVADRNTSRCHGWSAGPTHSLPAHVLGVRPREPGFASFTVEPQPGDLSWAEGAVPCPAGDISVAWRRSEEEFRLEVTVPDGCEAHVRLPRVRTSVGRLTVDGAGVEQEGAAVTVWPGRHVVRRSTR